MVEVEIYGSVKQDAGRGKGGSKRAGVRRGRVGRQWDLVGNLVVEERRCTSSTDNHV